MRKYYEVTVTRLQPQSTTFRVVAWSEAGARLAAFDLCGDHIFESSGDAYDEQVESCEAQEDHENSLDQEEG